MKLASRAARWACNLQKMAPKRGPFVESINPARRASYGNPKRGFSCVSKAEIGELAITDCNAGAAHEQTVDRREQATKKAGGRGVLKGGGIGHFGPHF